MFQVAVCNLASIALPMYVKPDKTFDFAKLAEVTKVITKNLNRIIDINYYPIPEVSMQQHLGTFECRRDLRKGEASSLI